MSSLTYISEISILQYRDYVIIENCILGYIVLTYSFFVFSWKIIPAYYFVLQHVDIIKNTNVTAWDISPIVKLKSKN